MSTLHIIHEEAFDAAPETVFRALHSPSAICQWWSALRAIVLAEKGGTWAAVWGEDEDEPDYTTFATIRDFEPPRKLTLADYRYGTKSGPLPFEADFVTSFEVIADSKGSRLRVTQDGFPDSAEGQSFRTACTQGWKDTFAGMRRYLAEAPAS